MMEESFWWVRPSQQNFCNNKVGFTLGPATAIVDGRVTFIGVLSFGPCSPDWPFGFARVSNQLDWIKSNSDVSKFNCRNQNVNRKERQMRRRF
jgi:hypothetical protein